MYQDIRSFFFAVQDHPIIPITLLEEDTALYGSLELDFADPMKNRHFSCINEGYSLGVYGILFAFYYGCSVVILTGMIVWHLNRSEGMRIGGGCW